MNIDAQSSQQDISKPYPIVVKKDHTLWSSCISPRVPRMAQYVKVSPCLIHHTNKRQKLHTISIDAKKAFDKIQHTFMIKNSYQSGYRGNISQHNKSHLWQTANMILWWKAESLPAKIWKKGRMPILTTSIHNSTGNPSHSRQKTKGIQIGREEVNLSLFENGMIIYVENPKDSTWKLLELIDEFSNVAGQKSNIQKWVAFLYTKSEITERKSFCVFFKNITLKITLKK